MDNLSKARLENIKLLQLNSGRNASRYQSVTAVTTTAVAVATNSITASAASDDQLKQMHREIKAHCIQLETAAADNSNIHAQNDKLRPDIAAATTTEDFRAYDRSFCAQLDVAKANATLLMEKLNDADLESQRKIDMYYKQRSIAFTHATMVENKCGRLEGKLRPIQAKVAAANNIADTFCKQLQDASLRVALKEQQIPTKLWRQLNGTNALLKQSQTRISQLERRISRAAKANTSLEDELANFSSKISGVLAEHNERDHSSTTIVISLKRMLSKANQQLHRNALCKRGLRNHNIITQRLDERT
ncbi:hypothetical protein LPJ66_005356 [Kickxella alabastrina]|uniref:Uncharacterized protein n=1 Tax=Kickxella alabastrina TaxID=61397 RepID=A0ACC1IJ45_9FUNG|nr:hypothetical protein LPJ66_005356 [Kickxella alabastrina]